MLHRLADFFFSKQVNPTQHTWLVQLVRCWVIRNDSFSGPDVSSSLLLPCCHSYERLWLLWPRVLHRSVFGRLLFGCFNSWWEVLWEVHFHYGSEPMNRTGLWPSQALVTARSGQYRSQQTQERRGEKILRDNCDEEKKLLKYKK